MTLFAETSPRIAYLGTGFTVDFVYPFRVLEALELAVYVDGELKGLGSHYLVTGIDRPTGGTVTFFTPPPLDALVLLMRDMPLTQPVDLREHDALSAETQEREYDRLTMLIQWQEDQHAHMLRLSDLSPTILPAGSLPEPELGKFLRWHDPTHLDNAEVVTAGTLTIGGDVAGHAAFWVAPQALGGDPAFYWDPARRGLKLARGMHEGATSILPHKDGPLLVFLKNSDNVAGYNGILVHVHNGAPTDTLSTLGNDKVAVGGWTKRGFGGDSPIYGGNFGVVFDTPGVANGVEIDVQNDSGIDNQGQALWLNGSGGNHRANAILIDTQDTTKWFNGIKFTHNAGGGATGCVLNAGILFDHNQSQGHIIIVPYDEVNPDNYVFELRDSTFETVKSGISKRGQFVGRADSTGFNQPTFSFVDDPRTGMFSPAFNHVAFSTIGFTRMTINPVGEVRIMNLVGSGTAGVSVEADGRLVRGGGGGGGGGGITSPLVVSGSASGELRLLELPANGTDYVGLKAPAAVAASLTWTWPGIDGTNGQVLTTDGAQGLSWTTPAGGGGGAVTSIGGLAGVIGTTSDVNVTMTSTAPNLVLGWAGVLSMTRGGTGGGGAPPNRAAFWTAAGLSGDDAFIWDNAVGGKRLTVGQPGVLASPSKVVTVAGRSVGGADPALQVIAAFAGASPTLNPPVGATFIGDFLGGGGMPAGFGVTVELALHDNAGAGTFIPAAFITSTVQTVSPPSTWLTFGTMLAGTATAIMTLSGAQATITPLVSIGVGSTGTLVAGQTALFVAGGNTGGANSVARIESLVNSGTAERTALQLVRTTPVFEMAAGFGVRQDFVLRDLAGVDNMVVRLIANMGTVDGTGIFRVQTAIAGVPGDRYSINSLGQHFFLPGASDGLVALTANGTVRTSLAFYTNSGAQAVAFIAPPTATGNHLWTLPTTLGAAGQVLSLLDGAGTLGWAGSAGGAVSTTGSPAASQFTFFSGVNTITSTSMFAFNPGTGVVTLLSPGSLHVGLTPLGGQAAGPVQAAISNSDNATPYQAILAQVVNGSSAGIGPASLANDKVALSGTAWRGAGGTSPLYGGHFNVTFATVGVANGIEVGVVNTSGTNVIGNGLWLNGIGTHHRDNAILIDTQNFTKWSAGIRFTEGNVGGGASGSTLTYGIIFDKSADADFLVIRPRLGANNTAIRITDPTFAVNRFTVSNVGDISFTGAMTSTGATSLGAGSISITGAINTTGNIGCNQYFAATLPGTTVNVVIPTVGTLHFTGGILTSVT